MYEIAGHLRSSALPEVLLRPPTSKGVFRVRVRLGDAEMKDLFTTAKIANFTAEEIHRYTEEQKMSYDYQNCLNYAVETAVEAAVKTATEKALAEGLEKGIAKGLSEGRVEGKAEGLADGINKARCETAKNMLHDNAPVDLISKYTGLTEEQILRLKSE